MQRRFAAALLLSVLAAAGCNETAVLVTIHAQVAIPYALDEIGLQLVAQGRQQYGRRWPLTEAETGSARTFSVVAGDQVKDSFDLLLTGERRGLPVSYQRKRLPFKQGSISTEHLYVPACQTPPPNALPSGTSKLVPAGGLGNQGPVVAVPSFVAPMSLIAPSSTPPQPARFGWAMTQDGQWGMGSPAIPDLGLPTNRASLGQVSRALAVDLDGDGDQDLVLLGEMDARIWWHNDDDTFSEAGNILSVGGGYRSVATADFDGDRLPDLVLVGDNQPIKILFNSRDAPGKKFGDRSAELNGALAPADGAVGVATGLLDGNSAGFVLARGGTLADVVVVSPDGGASFRVTALAPPVAKSATVESTSVTVADLNDDHLPDIAVGMKGSPSVVYLNDWHPNKAGSFGAYVINVGGAEEVRDIQALDLKNNCSKSIVVGTAQGLRVYDPQIEVKNEVIGGRNYPYNWVRYADQGTVPPAVTQFTAGDFDGDGLLEVAVTSPGSVSWLRQPK